MIIKKLNSLLSLGLSIALTACSGGGGGSGDKGGATPKEGDGPAPVVNYNIDINSDRCMNPFFAVTNYQEELASQIRFGDADCVKKLLELGAKATLDVQPFGSNNSVRPLEFAMETSSLFFAKSKLASFAVIKVLVEAGADMNEKNAVGSTFVHKAIQNTSILEEHPQVAGYLVQSKKADLDTLNEAGRSALHLALEAKKSDLALQMLGAGANIQIKTRQGRLPLILALISKLDTVADRIQESMPDIEVTDDSQNTALQLSIANSFEKLAAKLLVKTIHVDAKNQAGDTPLFTAIGVNSAAMVNALLQKGANPDLANNSESPIHFALKKQQPEIVGLLIQKATLSLNARDQESHTPLMLAVVLGSDLQTKALLDRKVLVDAANRVGETALHMSIGSNSYEKTKMLLSQGANVNATTTKNETPLHFVRSLGLAQLLVDSGAKIDPTDDSGSTPLSKQVGLNNTEICAFLLSRSANPQWRDSTQKSLLDMAVANNNPPLAQILLDKGVNPNSTNLNGDNSIFYAWTLENINLLNRAGAKVDVKNRRGQTALLQKIFSYNQSVQSETFQMIQRLIELGADVNIRSPDSGNSMLIEAIAANPTSLSGKPRNFDLPFENLQLMELLVKNKVNLNLVNRDGDSALHLADTVSEINLLREARADFNLKNKKGETALLKIQLQLSDLEFSLELDLKRRDEILTKLNDATKAKNDDLVVFYKRQLAASEAAIKIKNSQQAYLQSLAQALTEGGAR